MARGGRENSKPDPGPYEYHLLQDMASTPPSDSEKKIIDSDDEVLAQLGYTQGMRHVVWLLVSSEADVDQNSSEALAC